MAINPRLVSPKLRASSRLGEEPVATSAAKQALPLGLYLHIPFCQRKCPYCDFNTYAGLEDQFEAMSTALCRELEQWGATLAAHPLTNRPLTTVFVGGGTPTVLAAAQLSRLFETLHTHFSLAPDAEITCEANPGTVDRAKFQHLRSLGVNRLSLGVQSFQPDELAFLGRIHDVDDVVRAVEAARAAAFDNINLDFIFGLPAQKRTAWHATLDRALALEPEHLSLYSLIVEPNTPLHHWVDSGKVAAPDNDLAADLYEDAMQRMQAAGYVHYEVSNWARRASGGAQDAGADSDSTRSTSVDAGDSEAYSPYVSRHNLIYWRNQEYIGIGPGAHSHLRLHADADGNDVHGNDVNGNDTAATEDAPVSRRWSNRKAVPGYIRRMLAGEPVRDFSEELPPAVAMGETMMMGLRLVQEGVSLPRFQAQHGCELRSIYGDELRRLEQAGMLQVTPARVRVTPQGLLLANQVAETFLAD